MGHSATKQIALVLGGLTLLVVIALLGVSIATLVKVNKEPKYVEVPGGCAATQPPRGGNTQPSPIGTTVPQPTRATATTAPTPAPTPAPAPGSDQDTRPGIPELPNTVNVEPPAQLSDSAPAPVKQAFSAYLATLKEAVNTTVDPCNNFYEYSCAAFDGRMSFDVVQRENMKRVATALRNSAAEPAKQPAYAPKATTHFSACVKATNSPSLIHADGNTIAAIYKDYADNSGIKFPLFTAGWTGELPDAATLAKAMGLLSGRFGIDTLVSIGVDTNWPVSMSRTDRPYALLIAETQLQYPDTYYLKAWDLTKDSYRKLIEDVLTDVAKYTKNTIAGGDAQLSKDIDDLFEFELFVATVINPHEVDKRKYKQQFNPRTIKEATDEFKLFDTAAFLDSALEAASKEARDVVLTESDYKIVFNWPQQLKDLDVYIRSDAKFARVIANYFYIRLLLGKRDVLPSAFTSVGHEWMLEDLGHIGRRAHSARSHPKPRRHPSEVNADDEQVDYQCAIENAAYLGYVNARFFADELLPTEGARTSLRNNVALIVSKVLEGFQNQLDQLNWMTSQTKAGAYKKIGSLTRNIAWPNFIFDDDKLTSFYDNVNIMKGDKYIDIIKDLDRFAKYTDFQKLTKPASEVNDRADFLSSPSVVNAWFQPEANSITFPLGILQQPFFDNNYPAAVNFGALGVVAGHELGHSFDDEGVQWDDVGQLQPWVDDKSQKGFDEMAKCVQDQYSSFKPIPGSDLAVDGVATQGENIGDNGGIRAAYNAFHAYNDFYGPDDRLPDAKFDAFNGDQLFFLSFARVWCEKGPTAARLQKQLLVDPHSPSKQRVLGTIQNTPAFRAAFNCPVGSDYAPKEHCDVWASEVSVVTGIPPPPPTTAPDAPPLNIPKNPVNKGEAYQLASDFIEKTVDLSKDPCNDFGAYVCGNYKGPSSFADMDAISVIKEVNLLRDIKQDDIRPVKQAKNYFSSCSKDIVDPETMNGATLPAKIIGELETKLSVKFPLTQPAATIPSVPVDAVLLGKAIGFLAGNYQQSPLMQTIVYINELKPSDGYYLFFDGVNTLLPIATLQDNKNWEANKKEVTDKIVDILTRYFTATKVTVHKALGDRIKAEAANFAEFERALAVANNPTSETAQNIFNLYTVSDVITTFGGGFVSFDDLLTTVSDFNKELTDKLQARQYKFSIAAPGNMMAFSDALKSRKYIDGTAVDEATILNYIFFTVLAQTASYIPSMPAASPSPLPTAADLMPQRARFSNAKHPSPIKRHEPDVLKHPLFIASDVTQAEKVCRDALAGGMTNVNNRIFVDAVFDPKTRDDIRLNAASFAASISVQMRSMIDQLQWMSSTSKTQAYGKLDNLAKNILWPEIAYDNDKLSQYYAELSDFGKTTNWLNQQRELMKLNSHKAMEDLLKPSFDRTDFGDTSTVNAFYRPSANSITLLAAITQPPFYHPEWPAALNYGGIGLVLGHEITHGFDSDGVYYDGVGAYQPKTWMDDDSRKAFENMAQCVIDEYNQLCDKSDDPKNPRKYCVNGDHTKGENVADNGGIRSSFNAYREHIGLHGQDAALPGAIAGQFSADQLFFVNFARTWCDNRPLDAWPWGNEHAISHFRVLGTLRNFEPFRAAFNCPVGSKYAPKTHCTVWVDESKPELGVPPSANPKFKSLFSSFTH